jgi:DNA-binding transcriptional LysR family regulator
LTVIGKSDDNAAMLNPLWLQTFSTAAASASFTEAGRQLGLTQSTVSDHIRRLEESLGRRLFVRDTHSLALTADGESLLVHARLILAGACPRRSPVQRPRLRGRVRFRHSDDLAMGPLPDMLAAFRSQHPEVELEITIGLTSELYASLDQGKLDLLVGKRVAGESRGHSMFSTPMQWLTRPDTLVDLAEPLPLILLPEPSITRAATAGAGQVRSSLAHRLHQWQPCRLHGRRAGGLGLAAPPQHLSSRDLVPPLNRRGPAAPAGCGICGPDGAPPVATGRYAVPDPDVEPAQSRLNAAGVTPARLPASGCSGRDAAVHSSRRPPCSAGNDARTACSGRRCSGCGYQAGAMGAVGES